MILQFALLLTAIQSFAELVDSVGDANFTHNNSLSTKSPFTVTIFDRNKIDVTSSFKILLYSHQRDNASAQTYSPNATSIPHLHRRLLSRPMNECLQNRQFISSHCDPIDNNPDSLQAYTVICRQGPLGSQPTGIGRNSIFHRHGSCEPHEICIPTTSRITIANRRNNAYNRNANTRNLNVPTAACVTHEAYRQWDGLAPENMDIANFWRFELGLTGNASVVRAAVSREDMTTPMEVDQLEIEGASSSSGGLRDNQAVCRDCVDLGMNVEGRLKTLTVEATLMTTVQMGVTGVLWLAAMSG